MPDIINNPAVALYIATAVALVVMIGFFVYLWGMDRRVKELRRMLEAQREPRRDISEIQSEPRRPQRIEKELSNGFDRR